MKIDSEILCSFMDGELDEARADEVRAALEADEKLRAEYEALLKTARLVAGLPQVSAPPEIAAGIVAVAEREQLLGVAEVERPRRYGFRWGMSVAASLLVGVAVGILGYHGWTGRSERHVFSAGDGGGGVGPVVVSDRKLGPERTYEYDEVGDTESTRYSGKAGMPLGRDSSALAKEALGSSREEAGLPVETDISLGKDGWRAARSGPRDGEPSISYGGAEGPEAAGREAEQPSQTRAGYFTQTIEERDSDLYQDADGELVRGKGDVAKSKSGDISGDAYAGAPTRPELVLDEQKTRLRRAADMRRVPLEQQVFDNAGLLNQDMAVNLDFQREPLNVTVISNDAGKTVAYVRNWASNNYLVDLNGTSAKMNLPAYTQAVYVGQAGANNVRVKEEAVLLRTTKRQAVQIVNELQRQRPVVVEVQVQDRKNYLGLAARDYNEELKSVGIQDDPLPSQIQAKTLASTGVATKEEFQSDQMQSASVPGRLPTTVKPTDDAEAFRPREKQITGLVGAEGGQKTPQSTGENGEYARQIIFQLGNQMQVRSLDELVTLVVQVVDARRLNAVPTGAAELAPAQPPTQQSKPD